MCVSVRECLHVCVCVGGGVHVCVCVCVCGWVGGMCACVRACVCVCIIAFYNEQVCSDTHIRKYIAEKNT